MPKVIISMPGKRRRALGEESEHEESEEEEGEESEEEEEGEEDAESEEEEESGPQKESESMAHDVDPDHGFGKYLSEELYNECVEHFSQEDWDLLEPLEVGDDLPEPLPAAIVASIREQASQRLQMYKSGDADMASEEEGEEAEEAEEAGEEAGEEVEEAGEEAVSDIGAPPQDDAVEHAARPEVDVEGPPGLTDADRIKALTAENAFLKSEVEKYKKWSKGWRRYANELRANVGVPGAAMPANWEHPPFKLGFVMPLHYDTVQPPHKFKKGKTADNPYGIRFPHHVLLNAKTGLREYIVENRSLMVIHVGLFRHEDNQPAKGTDMTRAVVPRFKLQLIYADPPTAGDVVKTGDMRTAHPRLFDPPEEQIDEANMVDGAVTWTLKVLVTSRDTHNPTNRKFRFRVTCLNEELENYRLKIESVPFRILSRVNKKGDNDA